VRAVGRWSVLRPTGPTDADASLTTHNSQVTTIEFIARQMLRRTGVVFRRTLARERQPIPWRELVRVYRLMELRGEVRGGRFVAGFSGEQYALPEAIELLRKVRRGGERAPLHL